MLKHAPLLRLTLAASALGLVLAASSATAQEYNSQYYGAPGYGAQNYPDNPNYGPQNGYGPAYYRQDDTDQVVITGPRRHQERGELGGKIENVSMSRAVRFDDLDLRTGWGAHELRERIRSTAHSLCRQMDFAYPISTGDSPPCYSSAVQDAMYQADQAIANARGYASRD